MSALEKYARNELVFGSSGQPAPEGITVGPRKRPESKALKTAIGSAIGYSIPAVLNAAKAIKEGREVSSVSFGSMIGSGLGAVVGRHS